MAQGTPGLQTPDAPGSEYQRFVDKQLRRTRRKVWSTDLAVAMLLVVIWCLVCLAVLVLADHWLVSGGLGFKGRLVALVVFAAGTTVVAGRVVLPLLVRRINPLFAAATIERSQPGLKNSLINLLQLRGRNEQIAPVVYQAIEQRAAQDLSSIPIESTVDRSWIIKLGYLLLAVVVCGTAYKLFSPKDPLRSVERVLAPWADIAAPTRVRIDDISPGKTDAYVDERLRITARVQGLKTDEPVTLYYSTRDKQIVDAPLKMAADPASHFSAELPDTGTGLQQDLDYYLKAGDAQTERYHVRVLTVPSITVDRVEYKYPDYTSLPPRVADKQGDLRGLEGTQVTLHARATHDIRSAHVDFERDGRRDLPMKVDGREAIARFTLKLKPGTDKPDHERYQLLFTTAEGSDNPRPIEHKIEVVRDLAPEIAIVEPKLAEPKIADLKLEGPRLQDPSGDEPDDGATLNDDATLPMRVEANDPDFRLASVQIVAERNGKPLAKEELLAAERAGLFRSSFVFDAKKYQLRPGDRVVYWAAATDNKQPNPNRTETEKRTLRITSRKQQQQDQLADARRQQQKQPNDAQQPQNPPPQGQQNRDEQRPKPQQPPDARQQPPQPNNPEQRDQNEQQQPDQQQQPGGQQPGQQQDRQQRGNPQQQDRRVDPDADPGDAIEKINEHFDKKDQPPEDDQPQNQKQQPRDQRQDDDRQQQREQPKNQPGEQQQQRDQQQQGGGDEKQDDQQPQQGQEQQGQQGSQQQKSGKQQSGKQQNGNGEQQSGDGQDSGQSSGKGQPQSGKSQSGQQQNGQENQPQQGQNQNQPEGTESKGRESQGTESQGTESQQGGKGQNKGKQQRTDPNASGKEANQDDSAQSGDSKSAQGQKGERQQKPGDKTANESQKGSNTQQSEGQKGEGQRKGEPKPGQEKAEDGQNGGSQKADGQKSVAQQRQAQKREGEAGSQQTKEGEKPTGGEKSQPSKPGDKQQPGEKAQAGDDNKKQGAKPEKTAGKENQESPNSQSKPGDGGQTNDAVGKNADKPDDASKKEGGSEGENANTTASSPGKGQSGDDKKSTPASQESNTPSEKQPSGDEKHTEGSKDGTDATSPSRDKRDSDSEGQTGGDLKGGGQQGGGQRSNKEGTGSSGQNTSAEEGAGHSQEKGDGDTSSRSGDQAKGQKKTEGGKSSDEKGEGSKARQGGEKPGAGQQKPNDDKVDGQKPGDNTPSGNKPGESKGGDDSQQKKNSNDGSNQPSSGDQAGPGGKDPHAKPGPSKPGERTDALTGHGNPTAGGPSDQRLEPSAPQVGEAAPGEAANLDYARKATDLAIDRLKDQLAKGEPDKDLLDKLKWTKDDVKRFVEHWERMKRQASQPGESGQKAREELDKTLSNLGLRPQSTTLGAGRDDRTRNMRQTRRTAPPPEYAEQYRAYSTGTSQGND